MEKEILTVDEAASFTGFSKSHIYKLVHYRRIDHYKPNGKNIFFRKEDLEAYLLQGKREAKSKEEIQSIAANWSFENE
ncbi:helix-turn-helix transcriptional regulator [Robiginitalea aurantiaca]|uniref:Helix-turn-helix domain-containing protein n=1 Tax=Robiginitalea aurantiaca TaxID=3056915 RepID=A0ABT7WBG7_9FLAO|nr:helix-turn-helix domain-containing protein [Robiginitalea aurantiaca]MDM9630256.1 helix-turn-helix domain-containing protein [Robiginitalea aurantiaca]